MKNGAPAGNLKVLSDIDIEKIHNAAVSLLDNPGILCESEAFLSIMHKGGAKVDRTSRIVRVSAEMIDSALKSVPRSFVLYARNDSDNDLLIEPGRVYYGMGGTSEPLYFDYDLWRPRSPVKQDMVLNTRIGHALDHIDFVQALAMSGDYPANEIFFQDYDAVFRNTTKPTVLSVLERSFTHKVLEITAAASGGESALREKPCVLAMATPVSPLKVGVMHEGLLDAINAGLPVMYAPGPMMGATGPVTVAGCLALTFAEALFGLVLVQLVKPGIPFVLKPDTNVFDMKTSLCTYGSPEQALAKAAVAQMGRFYNVPLYGLGGGVESCCPDHAATAGAMMNILLNGLAGTSLSQALGTLAFGQYGNREMAVMCNECIAMAKRVLNGFEVNEDTLALDVIRRAGHGGNFLQDEHTACNFRKELFFPALFKRETVDEWIAGGALMGHQRAHQKVAEILAEAGEVPLLPGADEELRRAVSRAISGSYK